MALVPEMFNLHPIGWDSRPDPAIDLLSPTWKVVSPNMESGEERENLQEQVKSLRGDLDKAKEEENAILAKVNFSRLNQLLSVHADREVTTRLTEYAQRSDSLHEDLAELEEDIQELAVEKKGLQDELDSMRSGARVETASRDCAGIDRGTLESRSSAKICRAGTPPRS